MSGGHFQYKQYEIGYIADEIENYIRNCEDRAPRDWGDGFYEEPAETLSAMREAVMALRIASVYAQRVDWYLSGDDGPESFMERLRVDLEALK